MDVQGLLREEDDTWQELHALLERIPAERMGEPGVTPDGWSPKDVMFHLAAWLAECGVVLEQIRAGTYTPDDDDPDATDRKNREWFEVSQQMDLRTVRSELEASRWRARAEFGALDEVSPTAWEWFEESGPAHYREHLDDLRAWLG
jgi:hypothetical protein